VDCTASVGRRQTVLVNLAIFHDNNEILVGISDELDIVERIAIHEQKIGKRALFDDADFAWIGIARTGQRQ
jgi:hypothetical protein